MELQTIITIAAVFSVVVAMFFVFKKTASKDAPVVTNDNIEDLKQLKQEVDELKSMVQDFVSNKETDA